MSDKHASDRLRALRRKVRNLKAEVQVRDTSIDRWRKGFWFWRAETERQGRARQHDLKLLRGENLKSCEQIRRLTADLAAARASEDRLREVCVESGEYDDGTFMRSYRRCMVCLEDDLYATSLVHEPTCIVAQEPRP